MFRVWQKIRSMMKLNEDWYISLTDSQSAALLHHQDKNIDILQQIIRNFSDFNSTFISTVIFYISKICVENDELMFSYIRTVLEILVLFFITISNFDWIIDDRASYICRQTEIMSAIVFSLTQTFVDSQTLFAENCLLSFKLFKRISRRKHCRAKIIKNIIDLIRIMSLDIILMIFDSKSHVHQLNVIIFLKKLRFIDHYWIARAYSLVIESTEEESSRYSDEMLESSSLLLWDLFWEVLYLCWWL